jgi:ribosomal protein S27E
MTLECAQCGHHNDPTRVFCQNCGARLERPSGDEAKISGPTKVVVERRHRGRSAGTGMIGAIFGLIRTVFGTALFAALLALLIQMARQPDGVPPAQPANEAQAGQLLQTLQNLAGSTYARTIDITEAQANNYLKSSIVPDEEGTAKFLRADFSRAFVKIRTGELDFFAEQIFYGWPIYTHLTTVPDTSGGKLSLRVTGGGIGRMSLDHRLVPLLQRALRPVIASTSQAAAVLETVDGAVLSPSVAKLSWNAGKSPAE